MRRRVVHLPILSEQEHHDVIQGAAGLPHLRKRLASQHPVHEEFAKAYDNLGGTVGLTDWAKEHQTDFYKLFKSLAPTPQPVQHSGEINLRMSLAPNPALDGDFEQVQDADFDPEEV